MFEGNDPTENSINNGEWHGGGIAEATSLSKSGWNLIVCEKR